MNSNDRKINNLFLYWLIASLFLVFLIIIVGGLTRLTNSGLSIIEWELIKGILPPLSKNSWEKYFALYKTIPQYKLINYNMSLSEFKIIFYWEYFHRMLARLIGLFFIIPMIYFYLSNKIEKKKIHICFVIAALIIFQGVIGWYMVKSGLTNDITVSHYRLAIHLTTAILIITSIFWLIKNILSNKIKKFFYISNNNIPFQILILLIFFQIIMGAFVSGLDAGKIYQTWPLMGGTFIPDDLYFKNLKEILDFNNHSLIQFYHRNLAYVIILYSLILSAFIYLNKIINLYKSLNILLLLIFLQVILGIITLISGLNIYIASLHQITSVLLIFSALNLYYLNTK